MSDVSENQFPEVILPFPEVTQIDTISSNDFISDSENTEILVDIQQKVTLMSDYLSPDVPSVFSSTREISIDSIDAYFFKYQGEYVYIPLNQVEYLTLTRSNELINISNQTITCYSLDPYGNTVSQYRFSPFSKAQKYVYGYNGNNYQQWYWTSIQVYRDDSNVTFGQVGISNLNDFLLFGILFFVGIIALFRKGR